MTDLRRAFISLAGSLIAIILFAGLAWDWVQVCFTARPRDMGQA